MQLSRAVAWPFDEVDAAPQRAASPAPSDGRRCERSPRASAASSSDGLPAYGSGYRTPDALDVEKGGWPKEKTSSSESLSPAAGPSAAPARPASLGARLLRAIGGPLRGLHERHIEAPRRVDAVVSQVHNLIEQGKVAQRARDWETAIFLYESAFEAYEAHNVFKAREVEPFFGTPCGYALDWKSQPEADAEQHNILWQALQQDDNASLVCSLLGILDSQRHNYDYSASVKLIPPEAFTGECGSYRDYFFWPTRTALVNWAERQAHSIVERLRQDDDESAAQKLEPFAPTIPLAIRALSRAGWGPERQPAQRLFQSDGSRGDRAYFLTRSIAATLFPGLRTNILEDDRISCEPLIDLLKQKSLHKTLDLLSSFDDTDFFQKSNLKVHLSHISKMAANGDYDDAIDEATRLFAPKADEKGATWKNACLKAAHDLHAARLIDILLQFAAPLAPADLQERPDATTQRWTSLVLRLGPPEADSPPWFRFALLARLNFRQLRDVEVDAESGTVTQVCLLKYASVISPPAMFCGALPIGYGFRADEGPSSERLATKHWLQLAFETGNGALAARLNEFDFGPALSQDLLLLLCSTPHRSQAIAFFDELLPRYETAPFFLRAEVLRNPSIAESLPPHLERWLTA